MPDGPGVPGWHTEPGRLKDRARAADWTVWRDLSECVEDEPLYWIEELDPDEDGADVQLGFSDLAAHPYHGLVEATADMLATVPGVLAAVHAGPRRSCWSGARRGARAPGGRGRPVLARRADPHPARPVLRLGAGPVTAEADVDRADSRRPIADVHRADPAADAAGGPSTCLRRAAGCGRTSSAVRSRLPAGWSMP